jgi:hypothetical protein
MADKKEYNVDYQEMESAKSTTDSFIDVLNTSMDSVSKQMSNLNNESVFMGPACESAVQAHTTILAALSSNVSNFHAVSNYLETSEENYKAGDSTASDTVTSAGEAVGAAAAKTATKAAEKVEEEVKKTVETAKAAEK